MGKWIRTPLAIAALVFGFGIGAAAQSNGVLRGLIRDQTGKPVPGVVVTVEHPQQGAIRVALTDLRGEYAVAGLDRGTIYNVEVSHPHFRRKQLQAEADDRVTVRMKPRRSQRISSTER